MHRWLCTTVALALAAGAPAAELQRPGSVLVYPAYSGAQTQTQKPVFTIVSVTNTNLAPLTPLGLGGATNVQFEYVEALMAPGPAPTPPSGSGVGVGVSLSAPGVNAATVTTCVEFNRIEFLTPADTLSVLVSCHNPSLGGPGYLVVSAEDPSSFMRPWSHNHLLGSQFFAESSGMSFQTLPAISFAAIGQPGSPTDADGDGQLDFDGVEYEGIPDDLYLDSFVASSTLELVLINFTGGTQFTAVVSLDLFNDNEFALSASLAFDCWMQRRLTAISLAFHPGFLAANTPHDPQELDLNCDGNGDLETGWARIRGIVADSGLQTQPNPALLGALTGQPRALGAGKLLWGSLTVQLNGDFLKFQLIDPEF